MLSSDKNVETVGQLIELLRHYLGLQTEYVKLDVIEKVVRLGTAVALSVLFVVFFTAALFFATLALSAWLSQYVGHATAHLLVAGGYLLLALLLFLFRKPWIERPLVRFLASLLLN